MNLLATWQFNLIGFLICVVGFNQFYKLAVRNAKNDGAATILLQLIASVAALSLTPLLPIKFPTDIKYYLLLIGASLFYTITDRLKTTARKHLQVSVFAIVNQLTTVFLIVYGLTFFRETLEVAKLGGVGLILLANVLLLYKKGKTQLNRYIWMVVVATVAFATALSIDIGISQQFNLPIYIMLTLFIPAGMLFVGERIKTKDIVQEYRTREKRYYLLTGILWALMIFFSLRAYQFGKVTTVVPLQATNVLLNVLVAHFFLGERENIGKKIVAAMIVILGVCLTVW